MSETSEPYLVSDGHPLLELDGEAYLLRLQVFRRDPDGRERYHCAYADWPESYQGRLAAEMRRRAAAEAREQALLARLQELSGELASREAAAAAMAAQPKPPAQPAPARRRAAEPPPAEAPAPVDAAEAPALVACRHCNEEKPPRHLVSHELRCRANPNRLPTPAERRRAERGAEVTPADLGPALVEPAAAPAEPPAAFACGRCGGGGPESLKRPGLCRNCSRATDADRLAALQPAAADPRPYRCPACGGGAFAESVISPGRCLRCSGEAAQAA